VTLDHAAYERILAHVDDYLEVDPESLGAPDRVGYLADLRTLLEMRVEDVELGVETEASNGAGEAKAPESCAILAQSAHEENTIPLRIIPTAPVAPREQRLMRKRALVHETLVETGWSCAETARRLGIHRRDVSRLVKRYWPKHPPYKNKEQSKAAVLQALLESNWNAAAAARSLGIDEQRVQRMVKKYGWNKRANAT
jgi:transcriptional regulator with GAF, ATPase, and Fis domain